MLFSRLGISVLHLVPFLILIITPYFEQVNSLSLNVKKNVTSDDKKSLVTSNTAGRVKREGLSIGSGTECQGELMVEKNGNCYKIGTRGPCEANMVMDNTPENPFKGRCVCEMIKKRNRLLIYSAQHDRCYEIYTTGPCQSQDWLVMKDGKPTCESNPCLYFQFYQEFEGREFVWYKEECVELHKSSTLCQPNQIIDFSPNQVEPLCVSKKRGPIPLSLAVPDSSVPCPPEQMLDINSECRTIVIFDF